jgi:hypothetical protein
MNQNEAHLVPTDVVPSARQRPREDATYSAGAR